MTLKLKFDLDIVKMYLYTKNEVSMSRGSKVIARADRNTDRHTEMTENITYPHTWVVNIGLNFVMCEQGFKRCSVNWTEFNNAIYVFVLFVIAIFCTNNCSYEIRRKQNCEHYELS